MSILNVEHLSHGFGDRAIFQDVSFRLLRGEHIGLVGANGEGKSTFIGEEITDDGTYSYTMRYSDVSFGFEPPHETTVRNREGEELFTFAGRFMF